MTNLQYAIMEAYRDNLLSPEITIGMLEAASGELGPNHNTDRYLKKVKEFEDEFITPAKNSNWWTSEHTAKVNAYLNKIKTLYIGKGLSSNNNSRENSAGSALNGIRVAIKFELPANKLKFITNRKDLLAYMDEARKIKAKKDFLMSRAKDGYNHDAALYRGVIKKLAKYPEDRKRYEDQLKSLYDQREAARKRLASEYGIHIL